MNFVALFKEGGFIMFPLLLCSIAIWAVVFEKMMTLKKFKKESQTVYVKAMELFKEGRFDEAKGLFQNACPLVASPHNALLAAKDEDVNDRLNKVRRRVLETQSSLKKYMWILGTISSSAPFVGLFGTVLGIIHSFESIAVAGKSGFAVVAQGLSEALIATAAGIFVAIMAVVFYNYFQVRLTEAMNSFKIKIEDLSDLLPKS